MSLGSFDRVPRFAIAQSPRPFRYRLRNDEDLDIRTLSKSSSDGCLMSRYGSLSFKQAASTPKSSDT